MMLRASSQDLGDKLNLRAVVASEATDAGVPHSEVLAGFVDAVLTDKPELDTTRQAIFDALGPDGMVDTAAVIGNFQRMTRIADATGIPIDEGTMRFSADIQEMLALGKMPSARLLE